MVLNYKFFVRVANCIIYTGNGDNISEKGHVNKVSHLLEDFTPRTFYVHGQLLYKCFIGKTIT